MFQSLIRDDSNLLVWIVDNIVLYELFQKKLARKNKAIHASWMIMYDNG